MTNLAPDPAYADVLREMAGRMWQRIRETDDFNVVHSHYGMFRYVPVGPGKDDYAETWQCFVEIRCAGPTAHRCTKSQVTRSVKACLCMPN